MGNMQFSREEFSRWAGMGQQLLLGRGTVYTVPQADSSPAHHALMIALDRGETVDLTDSQGIAVSTLEFTVDGYIEKEKT